MKFEGGQATKESRIARQSEENYFALLKPGLKSEPPSFVCLEIAMVFFGFKV
jgi:hypothetical protein